MRSLASEGSVENAGRIYRPTGVYAGLSYELADLRICIDKRGYRSKTDLSYGSTELPINQSIVYYVLQTLLTYLFVD